LSVLNWAKKKENGWWLVVQERANRKHKRKGAWARRMRKEENKDRHK
jgi:hypothetical protein